MKNLILSIIVFFCCLAAGLIFAASDFHFADNQNYREYHDNLQKAYRFK